MSEWTELLQKGVDRLYGLIPHSAPPSSKLLQAKLIAHRGYWNLSDRKENTYAALDPCINNKIWAIEFDIRFTKDAVPLIHHDDNTLRVFGIDLMIHESTFQEIRSKIPQIPSFQELIERYKNKIHFMIEIKTPMNSIELKKFSDILSPLKPEQEFHIMSLKPNCFTGLEHYPSSCFVSIAKFNTASLFSETLKKHWGGFTGHFLLLNSKFKKKCQENNICVGTGFSDNLNVFYREVDRGIDWIFTNKAPEIAKSLP